MVVRLVPPAPDERSDRECEQPVEPRDRDAVAGGLDEVAIGAFETALVLEKRPVRLFEPAVGKRAFEDEVVAGLFERRRHAGLVGPHASDRSTGSGHRRSILVAMDPVPSPSIAASEPWIPEPVIPNR